MVARRPGTTRTALALLAGLLPGAPALAASSAAFGPVNLQASLTRDVVERDDGGPETRGWLQAIVRLYQEEGEVAPNRTLVARRQAE